MSVSLPLDKKNMPFEVMGLGRVHHVQFANTATTVMTATEALQTNCIRVFQFGQTWAHLAIGAGATAATTDTPIPNNLPEYFKCNPGDIVSVIGISATATADIYVTECV